MYSLIYCTFRSGLQHPFSLPQITWSHRRDSCSGSRPVGSSSHQGKKQAHESSTIKRTRSAQEMKVVARWLIKPGYLLRNANQGNLVALVAHPVPGKLWVRYLTAELALCEYSCFFLTTCHSDLSASKRPSPCTPHACDGPQCGKIGQKDEQGRGKWPMNKRFEKKCKKKTAWRDNCN